LAVLRAAADRPGAGLRCPLASDGGRRDRPVRQHRRLRRRGRARCHPGSAAAAVRGGAGAQLHPAADALAHYPATGAAGDDAGLRQPGDPEPQGHRAGVADHYRRPGAGHRAHPQPHPGQRHRLHPGAADVFRHGAGAGGADEAAGGAGRWLEGALMLFGFEWDTSSDWAFALSILPILLTALLTTLKAAAAGFALALVLGLLLAALKGAPLRLLRWPAALVVEFLRDTPLLIQLF